MLLLRCAFDDVGAGNWSPRRALHSMSFSGFPLRAMSPLCVVVVDPRLWPTLIATLNPPGSGSGRNTGLFDVPVQVAS